MKTFTNFCRELRKLLVCIFGVAMTVISTQAQALASDQAVRPRINLFPTAVVESLSETSQVAQAMESDMLAVVEKLEQRKQAYESTGCEGSEDKGCLQLRAAIRSGYKDMLDIMQQRIPDMRASLGTTADAMGASLRNQIGKKMTPGDVQRALAGRAAAGQLAPTTNGDGVRQGKLSKMFSRYYELVRRGGTQGEALPVLASQIYLDSVQSLYFLELIEAEIGSQNTELVLELEWGELTGQMSDTVNDVKTLLWGDSSGAGEILDVGLQSEEARIDYQDLLLD